VQPNENVTIEDLINEAWTKHDQAEEAGDMQVATYYKDLAFKLLEKLPQNQIHLRIKQ
jgi:hypothetical protein